MINSISDISLSKIKKAWLPLQNFIISNALGDIMIIS